MYNPFTGPFSFWGVMYMNGVQTTGVERAGQGRWRREQEKQGRENSGLKSHKTSGPF